MRSTSFWCQIADLSFRSSRISFFFLSRPSSVRLFPKGFFPDAAVPYPFGYLSGMPIKQIRFECVLLWTSEVLQSLNLLSAKEEEEESDTANLVGAINGRGLGRLY